MSNILNKVLNIVGLEIDEEEIEKQEEKPEKEKPQFLQSIGKKNPPQNKVVNLPGAQQLKVVVLKPHSFNDAREVCDHLRNKKPIIVNLEEIEKENAQRIIDFISGSIYALDGNIQKVANEIFIVAPCNVDIMGDVKEENTTKTVFPWSKT
jgi:cell division inhibitor SepF